MNNRMTTFTPQKAYLLIGLALIAQYLVSALASNLIFMPYADPEKLQNLVKIISPTGFLLLMYVPRVIGVIVFWLIARIVPFERKAGSKIGFGSIMQLFFIMYAVSSVFNAIGTGIKMLSPADAASQTDQLSDIIATGNIGGFVIVLMLAPIFEEIVFRKLILDRVSKYGEANAILFSAICFGLFHENLSQSLYTFCIGLALGYVYIKTRNVFITIGNICYVCASDDEQRQRITFTCRCYCPDSDQHISLERFRNHLPCQLDQKEEIRHR